jgi:Flp pilus assembly protein TadG
MSLARGERGQALVIVAIAIAALIVALAFTVDWGYGLSQRRVVQNRADAAVLGAAKLLASSVQNDGSFAVSREQAWCEANRYAAANVVFSPGGGTATLSVSFGDAANPPTFTSAITNVAVCPPGKKDPATPIPNTTVLVRVSIDGSYPAMFGAIAGRGTIPVGASARAMMTGSPGATGPVWPMLRHFDPNGFSGKSCGPSCDPTTVTPVTFWTGTGGASEAYGNYKMFVDVSRYSNRMPASFLCCGGHSPAQLLTTWDQTGSTSATPSTSPKPDQSGACGRPWDTSGSENPTQQNSLCSLPNYLYYGFGGNSTIEKNWWASLPAGQETPTLLSEPRFACTAAPSWLRPPSCDTKNANHLKLGDWLETTYRGGPGDTLWQYMAAYVARNGDTTDYSEEVVPPGQPNEGKTYGKAVQMLVYFWDCAESWNATFQRWDLIPPTSGSDCSRLPSGSGVTTADRVHVFTYVPFTFYEGLVTADAIQGYWGGTVEKPGACKNNPGGCLLNPISNSVFLVADD